MAWTTPKTWVTGEVLTSDDLNTYVKENTDFLFNSALVTPLNLLPGQTKTLIEPIGNGSTVLTQLGSAVTGVGTATARAVASTNFFTSRSRLAYVSGATAGNAAGIRLNSAQLLRRDQRLIRMRFGFGFSTNAATTKRAFCGFREAIAALPNTAFTSTTAYFNIFGVGMDSGDTTLKLYHNDDFGAPTVIDLGFPVNTINTSWFSVELLAFPDTAGFYYRVHNSDTDTYVEGTVTTDIPANTVFLSWLLNVVTTAASARGIDIGSVSVETQDPVNNWRT